MNANVLLILPLCLTVHVAFAQGNFTVPFFASTVKPASEACMSSDAQADLQKLETIQEAVRAVIGLLPQVPRDEENYIRAEKKRIWASVMNGQTGISERASAELRRRPLFLAWDIRDDAAAVQREIAMQHGYENARKLTPNVDSLAAQQSVDLLFEATRFDRSVRINLKKAARGLDEEDIKSVVSKTEWAIVSASAFVRCKISRSFYAEKR